ncbi:MAG: hypothetical protein HYU36_18780 [Planctomycetes bacterium]|nr:hypothetical protein [Planctomycetota bacterium]
MPRDPNRFYLRLVLCISFGLTHAARGEPPQDPGSGRISGRMLRNGSPSPVQVNLHRAGGSFVQSVRASPTGAFDFNPQGFGRYFVITQPEPEMPLQWVSQVIQVSRETPHVALPDLDCFAAGPISPAADQDFHRDEVREDRPILFRWSHHPGPAQYEISVQGLENGRSWKSGRVRGRTWRFTGGRLTGRRPLLQGYRWQLHVYPEHGQWHGHSRERLFYRRGYGRSVRLEGEFMFLEIPRWYRRFAEAIGLLAALDASYRLQQAMVGTQPFSGRRWGVLFDPAIQFAHSGNPVHVGSNFWRHDRPPWDTILHEMGHDFQTGSSRALTAAIVHQQTGYAFYHNFVEGLATLAVFYIADHAGQDAGGGFTRKALESMDQVTGECEKRCRLAWQACRSRGRGLADMDPDATDGMLLVLRDEFGWEMFERFFRLFLAGRDAEALCHQARTHEERVALVLAALSVSASTDLSARFREWGFPLVTESYERFLAAWGSMGRRAGQNLTGVTSGALPGGYQRPGARGSARPFRQ